MANREFWDAWIHQTHIYELTECSLMRPTIDRIDETGDYELDNIQCLSKLENTKKARQKLVYVFDLNQWSFRRYPSQKIAKSALGERYKALDQGIAIPEEGSPFLVQSEATTHSTMDTSLDKDEVSTRIRKRLDLTRTIIKAIKQGD